jgi:hypothetical protein
MTMPANNPETDDDEFAALKTLDAIAAYLHQRHGEQALRQVLAMGEHSSEFLTDAALELEVRGLDHVAAVLRDVALTCPSEIDANPYEPGSLNWHYRHNSWLRRRRIQTGEVEAHLRQREAQKQAEMQMLQLKVSQTRH